MGIDLQLYRWPIVLATVTLAGAGAGGGWYIEHHKPAAQETSTNTKHAALFRGGLPGDFFSVTPKKAEAAPEPPKLTAPTPKPHVTPPRTKAPSRPKIDPELLRRRAAIVAFNNARRDSGVAMQAVVKKEGGKNQVEWINTDKDYTKQGEKKNVASFPVDLTRTITVAQDISATLITAIDSELPGKVKALIDNNIYGAQGRLVLIPAGSVAVGKTFPLKKVGDTRLHAVWTRIITPAGINIELPAAQIADAMGRSGVTGDLDTRVYDRYGVALLISTIAAAGQLSVPTSNYNQALVVNSYGRELSRVTGELLNQNINLAPIVRIDAGTEITIQITKDIWFKKPVRNVVQVVAAKGAKP